MIFLYYIFKLYLFSHSFVCVYSDFSACSFSLPRLLKYLTFMSLCLCVCDCICECMYPIYVHACACVCMYVVCDLVFKSVLLNLAFSICHLELNSRSGSRTKLQHPRQASKSLPSIRGHTVRGQLHPGPHREGPASSPSISCLYVHGTSSFTLPSSLLTT